MEERDEFVEDDEQYVLTEREIAAGVMVGIIKALAVFFLLAGVITAIFEFGLHVAIPFTVPATYSIILGGVLFVVSFIL